jgi:glucosamine-6-phosphate deaminase
MSVQKLLFDQLPVEIHPDNAALWRAAAERTRSLLRDAIQSEGSACMIVATGNSQLGFYAALRGMHGIDWGRITIFHMDEYVGIRADHPASFRRYLHRQIVDVVLHPAAFYEIIGDAPNILEECNRYADLLRLHPAAICCLGIGENGHLAFNDPPKARFDDPAWVKVVKLEMGSRLQQVGEGHFPDLNSVPRQAITLTIPALLSARNVLAIVPEKRKAAAVRAALTGPISSQCPASILRSTPQAILFLDSDSASELDIPRIAKNG